MPLSHAVKLAGEDTRVVVLLRATNDQGNRVYFYLAVPVKMYDKFREVEKSGQFFDPEDFGVVVESGVGEPSDEVRKRMAEIFGPHDIDSKDEEVA